MLAIWSRTVRICGSGSHMPVARVPSEKAGTGRGCRGGVHAPEPAKRSRRTPGSLRRRAFRPRLLIAPALRSAGSALLGSHQRALEDDAEGVVDDALHRLRDAIVEAATRTSNVVLSQARAPHG